MPYTVLSFKDFYLNESLPLGNEPIQVSIDWVSEDKELIEIPAKMAPFFSKEFRVGDVLSIVDDKFIEQYRAVIKGPRLTRPGNQPIYPIKRIVSPTGL